MEPQTLGPDWSVCGVSRRANTTTKAEFSAATGCREKAYREPKSEASKMRRMRGSA